MLEEQIRDVGRDVNVGLASRRQSRPQVSRLHLQSQQLADENRTLTEKDAQNIAEMETLQQQLAELMEDGKKREAGPKEDKSEVNGVWRRAGGLLLWW